MTATQTTAEWLGIIDRLNAGQFYAPTGTIERMAPDLAYELNSWIDRSANLTQAQGVNVDQIADEYGWDEWDIFLALTLAANGE